MGAFGRALLVVIAGLCGGAIVVLSPDVAGAALVLLLPGLLVLLFDPTPGRPIGRTILLFEAAGCVRPLASTWLECDGLRHCVGMVTGTRTLLTILLFVGIGVLLTAALPMVLQVVDTARTRVRLTRLAEERQRVVEEWEF